MIEWWHSIKFENSLAFWLFLLLPLLALAIFLTGRKGKPLLRLSTFRYLQGLPEPAKVKWRGTLFVLRFLGLAALILAFARPQSKGEWKRSPGKGIDIILCIDVSLSMDNPDFSPTRLGAAKNEAIKFVDQRPNDRIGLVIFSGESFTMCPLTTDHQALKNILANVSLSNLDRGTAIGMGLAKSVERLEKSKSKSKVVVLLTDGENNAGIILPVDAARLAKTFDVRVYTIGLGMTEGLVSKPLYQNPDGTIVYEYGEVNISDSSLTSIASITGGKYFRATDEKALQTIYAEIDKLEKTEFDKKEKQERKEEFLPFLFIALAAVGLEFVLRYTVFDTLT
ncbi:MAG TPA: VWA domain-containing protein [Bacteroidia bacterium]|nr:VWA domain-containing protein [Bacteroidia bacterium]